MLNVRSNCNCGTVNNWTPKRLLQTGLPTPGRLTASRQRSKDGKRFRYLGGRVGRTNSFWTLLTAACRRAKAKRFHDWRTIEATRSKQLDNRDIKRLRPYRRRLETQRWQSFSANKERPGIQKTPGRPNSPPQNCSLRRYPQWSVIGIPPWSRSMAPMSHL